jgi:tetratricopeptide (TPR) repeat protein
MALAQAAMANGGGQYNLAEEASRRALKADPKSTIAWFQLVRALRGLKKYDEAEKAFRKVLDLKPTDLAGEASSALGWVLYERKKYREAEAACRKSRELDPDSHTCW